MKYALLDDQLTYHEEFKRITKKYINYSNCNFYCEANNLYHDLETKDNWHLDVLFLDIELANNENGIKIMKNIAINYPNIIIIFITNKSDLVYDAFGINVFKFIYKPQFEQQVDKIFQEITTEISLAKPIKVKSYSSYISLSKKEIVLVSKELRKIYIYTYTKKIETNFNSLTEVITLLDSNAFILINRSQIINIKYISSIEASKITTFNKLKHIYISRKKLTDTIQRWKEYNV